MGKELSLRNSLAVSKSEGQALVAIQRAQYDAAVRTAQGIGRIQTIAMVGEGALDAHDRVASRARDAIERNPWAAQGAFDIVKRIDRSLGHVIDDLERWP